MSPVGIKGVYALLLANIITFAFGWVWPLEDWKQVLLYGFSHLSWLHFGFNMLALLSFGLGVERTLGRARLLYIYLGSVVLGGFFHLWFGSDAAAIGASAGIYGLLVTYAFIHGTNRVIFIVFPMRAVTLAYIAIAIESILIVTGWVPQIAHWAHLGGAAFAFTYMMFRRGCAK